jgi:hypothetical protein
MKRLKVIRTFQIKVTQVKTVTFNWNSRRNFGKMCEVLCYLADDRFRYVIFSLDSRR